MISADGHAVSSGFVFTVGDGAPRPPSRSTTLLAGGETGPVTNTALAVARGVQYARDRARPRHADLPARVLAAGAAPSRRRAGARRPDAFARRTRLLLVAAIAAGVLSAARRARAPGRRRRGRLVLGGRQPDVVGEVLGTRFGTAWGLGALAWVAVAGRAGHPPRRAWPRRRAAPLAARPSPCIAGPGRSPRRPRRPPHPRGAVAAPRPARRSLALAVPLFALALLPALGGHASVQSPVALLLPANVLHVLAMSAWLGGIAVLVLALRAATAQLEPRRADAAARRRRRRASRALASIALRRAAALRRRSRRSSRSAASARLLDTAFGRAVLIKVVRRGRHRRARLHQPPAAAARAAQGGADGTTPGRAGVLLRRTLRLELALGVAALAATGALSGYAPSIAASTGPYATTATSGPRGWRSRSTRRRSGPTSCTCTCSTASTGAPFDATKELARDRRAAAPRASRRSRSTPHVAGPGHYVVDGATLVRRGRLDDLASPTASRTSTSTQTHFTVPIK